MNAERNALIVGGASGFGLAIARTGADRGWNVVIADVSETALTTAVDLDPRLRALQVDVTDPQQVRTLVASADSLLGGIDTVVMSAGVIHVKPLAEVTEADWDLTLSVNLKGAFLLVQSSVDALVRSGRGRVIFLSSMSGKTGRAELHAYSASKFGLIGLSESLAAELAPHRVTVNCICPASSPTTGMGRQLAASGGGEVRPADLEAISATFPVGRYILESDVATAAMYLASDDAAVMTGATIDLDGGRRFR